MSVCHSGSSDGVVVIVVAVISNGALDADFTVSGRVVEDN